MASTKVWGDRLQYRLEKFTHIYTLLYKIVKKLHLITCFKKDTI